MRARTARAAWGAALCAAGVLTACAAAQAAPSLDEAAAFARREMMRLCDDRDGSRFDRVDDAKSYRNCASRVNSESLLIDLRLRESAPRKAGEEKGRRWGRLQTEFVFGRTSMFFCGGADAEGWTGLFYVCERERQVDGAECVVRTEEARLADGRLTSKSRRMALAKVIEVQSRDCGLLERSLNYVIENSRSRRRGSVRGYFEE